MSSEAAISVNSVGKCYHLYHRSEDRLKQVLLGRWHTYYREFYALNGVDLQIKRGESVGIIGRNGAGKSTLLQIISGLLQPTSGTVSVRGRIAPLLQLGTSFNPEFTGQENISLAASILGLSTEDVENRRGQIIAFAELGDFISQPVRTYSSGMMARLAFAIAAHVNAEILIVDEVLSVGDVGFNQKCARYLKDFRERGTLLFVSHDIGAVLALCDRTVWLDRGVVVEDAPPARVVPHYMTWMANPEKSTAAEFLANVRQSEKSTVDIADSPAQIAPLATIPKLAAAPRPQAQPETTITFGGFDWDARSAGSREGVIVDAWWEDTKGEHITVLKGGDTVTLVVKSRADASLTSPIIGFGVKDRLGQVVFAWDTSREPDLLGKEFRAGVDVIDLLRKRRPDSFIAVWDDVIIKVPARFSDQMSDYLRDCHALRLSKLVQSPDLPAGLAALMASMVAHVADPPPIAEIHAANERNRDAWVKAAMATIPSGSRVLDVGAGTCPYQAELAHTHYEAHDFKAYEGYSKPERGEGLYGKIDYVSDILALPVPDACYDAVLCTEVLEHVPEPIAAVGEMARVLKPGGRMFLTAPLGSGLHQEPYHFYGGYTPHWYRFVAARFGLQIIELSPNGGFYQNLAQECARVAWTLPANRQLFGSQADAAGLLFGELLPRYLMTLERSRSDDRFAVGFHVILQRHEQRAAT